MSPCGDPVTLEVCVKESRACKKCLPAAKTVAKMVSKGEAETEIRAWLENRFDDKAVKQIDVGASPSLGPADASITIIEWADFECPHCGMAAPVLHKTVDEPEFKPKTRFVFKNYPLPSHEHADPAARASVAAQNQGKFWEMHDQLFTHQETLTNQDIEGFAKKLGLDMDKFKTDWASNDTKDKVAKDKEAGSKAGITGTPSIFINGRKFMQYGHGDFGDQLKDWMRLELAIQASGGAPPRPAPAPSASVSK
jgi:protein-disulfide isomerase